MWGPAWGDSMSSVLQVQMLHDQTADPELRRRFAFLEVGAEEGEGEGQQLPYPGERGIATNKGRSRLSGFGCVST